ncbi:MAG: hypothetical protein ACM3JB_00610 [Acidobacteriaceae bacterium]
MSQLHLRASNLQGQLHLLLRRLMPRSGVILSTAQLYRAESKDLWSLLCGQSFADASSQ